MMQWGKTTLIIMAIFGLAACDPTVSRGMNPEVHFSSTVPVLSESEAAFAAPPGGYDR